MLLSLSFCSERTKSANCCGPEIGWQQEAIKDNRPVLKFTSEWSGPLACPSKLFVIHFPHIQLVHSWLSNLFGGPLWICMFKSLPWLPDQEFMSMCISPNIYQEAPNQFGTCHLVWSFWWPSLSRLSWQQSSLICSEQSLGQAVPLGLRTFVSDKKKHTQETG